MADEVQLAEQVTTLTGQVKVLQFAVNTLLRVLRRRNSIDHEVEEELDDIAKKASDPEVALAARGLRVMLGTGSPHGGRPTV